MNFNFAPVNTVLNVPKQPFVYKNGWSLVRDITSSHDNTKASSREIKSQRVDHFIFLKLFVPEFDSDLNI